MARPTSIQDVQNVLGVELDPDTQTPGIVALFAAPTGMNLSLPLPKIDTNTSPFLNNLRLDERGIFVCRAGTDVIGSISTEPQLGALIYRDSFGGETVIRFTTNHIQYWNNNVWVSLSGPLLGLTQYEFVQSTIWNNFLMVLTTTGLYQVDLANSVYTIVSAAPAGKHITTFGGRLIVSYIYGSPNLPTRLQWSVKDDSTDWTGLGSGFEDLLSAPGGVVDIQHGVFPVNDQEALIVRSSSVWLAQLTGQFDAPFNFYYLYGGVQCDSPYSVASVPTGTILLSRDNITFITTSGPTQIGDQVRSAIFTPNSDLRNAVGTYDSFLREYRLMVPQKSFDGRQVVYRYRIDTKQWFQDTYPYQIKRINCLSYESHTQVVQLTGTIGSLTGPINQLGLSGVSHSGLITQKGVGYVMKEDYLSTTESDGAGGVVDIPIELQTGLVTKTNILDYADLLEQIIELAASENTTLTIDYKDELGEWVNYSAIIIIITALPQPFRATKRLRRKQLQLRLTSTNGGGLQIMSWYLSLIKGGKVNW